MIVYCPVDSMILVVKVLVAFYIDRLIMYRNDNSIPNNK